MPAPLLALRWALTPPFHPYLRANHEDIPKVFLRAITGCRTAGGIFSVALSVNRYNARLGRRPLQQLPWRYQARCPHRLRGFGVRTFLPPSPLPRTRPAIIQLTRQLNYIKNSLVRFCGFFARTALFQRAVHHEGIDEAQRRVLKGQRQAPHCLEAEAGPELDCALIGADHEVELHRAKAAFPGSLQRMQAHLARDASALRGGRSDI